MQPHLRMMRQPLPKGEENVVSYWLLEAIKIGKSFIKNQALVL